MGVIIIDLTDQIEVVMVQGWQPDQRPSPEITSKGDVFHNALAQFRAQVTSIRLVLSRVKRFFRRSAPSNAVLWEPCLSCTNLPMVSETKGLTR